MCYIFKWIFNMFLMFECHGLHELYEIDDSVKAAYNRLRALQSK
jgi:hypothetical protein